MLPVSQAGIVVKNFGEAIKKLQELYTIIKLDSSKSRRKKRIKDMTKIYKDYRYLCEDLNKNSLVITRYDKDSLRKFSQECKSISDKYKAKVNKFKIWSKELSKQKEIVKYGLQNLMNENTNNDPTKIQYSIKLKIEKNKVDENGANQILEKISDKKKYKVSIYYKEQNKMIDYITIDEVKK